MTLLLMATLISIITSGQHHVGIDPNTGQVWYQEAAGYTNFNGGTYENPNGPAIRPLMKETLAVTMAGMTVAITVMAVTMVEPMPLLEREVLGRMLSIAVVKTLKAGIVI